MCHPIHSLSTKIDTSTLPHFAGMLCWCRFPILIVFCDWRSTGNRFCYWRSIDLVPLIDFNRLQNQQILLLLAFLDSAVGLLELATIGAPLVAVLGSHSIPVFLVEWNGHAFPFLRNSMGCKHHHFYAYYSTITQLYITAESGRFIMIKCRFHILSG